MPQCEKWFGLPLPAKPIRLTTCLAPRCFAPLIGRRRKYCSDLCRYWISRCMWISSFQFPVKMDVPRTWFTSNVVVLLNGLYSDGSLRMILRDALMDAGCDDEELLNYLVRNDITAELILLPFEFHFQQRETHKETLSMLICASRLTRDQQISFIALRDHRNSFFASQILDRWK